MASEKEFRHESLQDNQSIIKYLDALLEGFKKGELTFKQPPDFIVLNPEGLIQLEIKAQRKTSKSKLSLKFSWKENPEGKEDKPDALVIDSARD